MRFLVVFTSLLFSILLAWSQEKEIHKESVFYIAPTYQYQVALNDFKEDYGNASSVGMDITYIFENNIFLSSSSSFSFSKNVNDTTILDHLMDDNRNIIDQNGQYADVLLQYRGWDTKLCLGYIFPILEQTSGILSYASLGFHQNKTRIDVRNGTVPQLNEDYKKMYDQLRDGLSSSLFVGYLHKKVDKKIHFYAGMEYTIALSKNRRSYNYKHQGPYDKKYLDGFLNFKFGWIIPISKRSTREFYYF